MKIKLALWMAPLTLSLVAACGGDCFAQSSGAVSPAGESAGAVLVAAAETSPADRAAAQADESSANTGEEAAALPAPPAQSERPLTPFSRVGIGLKLSDLGVGIEAATPIARKFNVRAGFNMLRFDRGITNDGIHYNGQLQLQSAEAHLDYYIIGGLHISPGLLFYNGNEVTATAAVPGGSMFSLGGTSYESDPAVPVTGNGKLDFVKVSPSIMFGIGNLVPRNGRHFSFLFEVGAAYQGSARVALNLAGNVCDTTGVNCAAISSDPAVQANIASQQAKIQNDVNPYKFFPIVSAGFGFNF